MLRGFGSADTLGPWRNQASPSAEAMRSRFVRSGRELDVRYGLAFVQERQRDGAAGHRAASHWKEHSRPNAETHERTARLASVPGVDGGVTAGAPRAPRLFRVL